MNKILVPTDFSKNAYNALEYAVQLFSSEECEFFLLNTYTQITYESEFVLYSNASSPNLGEIFKQGSINGLIEVEKQITGSYPNSKHTFYRLTALNILYEEIKEQVKTREIDLVVMGTQGATGADKILFGSHTVHAIKRTVCPLLAIPSGFKYKSPTSILFPTDFDINYTIDQLKILKQIAGSQNSIIHVLHVHFGFPLEKRQEKAKDILAAYLQDAPHLFCSVESNTVANGIYQYQSGTPTQMLTMITNKHSFYENLLFTPVTNEIGFNIKVPFLVIPSGKYNV